VTQGEDGSRIRVSALPVLFATARNLALNLYRDAGETNTALLGLMSHPETPRFLARQRFSGFHCTP